MSKTAKKSNPHRLQRKRFLVDRKVQGALARRMLFHWFVFLFVTALVLPMFGVMFRGDFTMPLSENLKEAAANLIILLVVFACLLPYFLLDSFKLSNRFAGPVFRLHRAIRALARGKDPGPVRFRDGDFWQELAEDFNVVRQNVVDDTAPPADAASTESESPVHHVKSASM